MILMNPHLINLERNYLFAEINEKIMSATQENKLTLPVIRMGIGDVTKALPKTSIRAFKDAADEMASDSTMKGYGPDQGYDFLRSAISEHEYRRNGISVLQDEIFISDGSKSDTGNFQELFSESTIVALPDPVYPVYADSHVMAGRSGPSVDHRYENMIYLPCTPDNHFIPDLPDTPADLIYLCNPNNPTGSAMTYKDLRNWVTYAKENKSLILYDAAYEKYITSIDLPRSIFEIEGSKEVCVEFRSFSKSAGFTGLRCAYTVIPRECMIYDSDSTPHSLQQIWKKRQAIKFNGVSYPVQRAAEALYTEKGKKETEDIIKYYMKNARLIKETLTHMGLQFTGGSHSPYLWVHCNMDSWAFFELLLIRTGIVCTPGAGFGRCGQNYIRLSSFACYEDVKEAMSRMKSAMLIRV